MRLKCDGARAETRFRLSAKQTSLFKSAGASVQSHTGSRGVRISGSNAGYAMFWGSVQSTGYPLHSPVSPSLPLPYVTVCHHISTALYCYWHFRYGLTRPAFVTKILFVLGASRFLTNDWTSYGRSCRATGYRTEVHCVKTVDRL